MKNKNHLITAAVIIFFAGIILLASPFILLFIQSTLIWPRTEKATDKEVRQQVAQLPNVTLNRNMLWEGDSMVTLTIKDKGEAIFWYKLGGPPQILSLKTTTGKNYSTEFDCEDKTSDGKRKYAYNVNLEITKNNPLGKLFPFEVKTIPDLVNHYDAIISILATFPKQTETVTINDSTGTRQFTKNPDPKYAFYMNYHTPLIYRPLELIMGSPNKNAVCYYYLKP